MTKASPESPSVGTTRNNVAADDDVRIRRYRSSDSERVRDLFVEGMRGNHEGYVEKSLNTDLSDIEGTYATGRGAFFVMERSGDEDIVGMVGLQDLGEIDEVGNNKCELRRMSIHSSERLKGRGRMLVDHALGWARQKKIRKIELTTGSWMEVAMKFYQANGFTDCGRFSYQVPDSEQVVTVAKFEMIL